MSSDLAMPLDSAILYHAGSSPAWASSIMAARRQLMKGQSVKRTARVAGIHFNCFYRTLNGYTRPSLGTGLAMARAIGVSPATFHAYWLHQRATLKASGWVVSRPGLAARRRAVLAAAVLKD